jgi:hypothetical protein
MPDARCQIPDTRYQILDTRYQILDTGYWIIAGCGKAPLSRHSRESGSPEGIEKTGFPLPRE